MTRKTILSSIVITSLLFISCKKELVPQDDSSYLATKDSSLTDRPTTQKSPTIPNTIMSSMIAGQTVNPAHGQPGHRCDIAVGAPLNTSANQTVATPITTTAKPTTVTPKGMNPPHGEKGHRCDIPVGASLSTPVAKTATETTTKQTTETAQYQSLVTNPDNLPTDSKTNAVTTAEGMNPPHGQDGHRCDIPVGQPLPKT